MDDQFRQMHERGLRWPDIAAMLRRSQCHKAMLDAIAALRKRHDTTVVNLSSGNTALVTEMLAQAGHAQTFDHVIAQHTKIDEDGRLRVWHRQGLDDPHQCPNGCYTGMCKGDSLEQVVRLADYDQIVYQGDGSNDLCLALRLREGDLVLPREGYPLHKALLQRQIKATVKPWKRPEDNAHILDAV